jgi:hypothetical protein
VPLLLSFSYLSSSPIGDLNPALTHEQAVEGQKYDCPDGRDDDGPDESSAAQAQEALHVGRAGLTLFVRTFWGCALLRPPGNAHRDSSLPNPVAYLLIPYCRSSVIKIEAPLRAAASGGPVVASALHLVAAVVRPLQDVSGEVAAAESKGILSGCSSRLGSRTGRSTVRLHRLPAGLGVGSAGRRFESCRARFNQPYNLLKGRTFSMRIRYVLLAVFGHYASLLLKVAECVYCDLLLAILLVLRANRVKGKGK